MPRRGPSSSFRCHSVESFGTPQGSVVILLSPWAVVILLSFCESSGARPCQRDHRTGSLGPGLCFAPTGS